MSLCGATRAWSIYTSVLSDHAMKCVQRHVIDGSKFSRAAASVCAVIFLALLSCLLHLVLLPQWLFRYRHVFCLATQQLEF